MEVANGYARLWMHDKEVLDALRERGSSFCDRCLPPRRAAVVERPPLYNCHVGAMLAFLFVVTRETTRQLHSELTKL